MMTTTGEPAVDLLHELQAGSVHSERAIDNARAVIVERDQLGQALIESAGQIMTLCREADELEADRDAWRERCERCERARGVALERAEQAEAAELAAIDRAEHAKAKAVEARADGDSWRLACNAWQDWAAGLLSDLGRQTLHGEMGDGPAREVIAQLAGMAPGVPLCLRCRCFATRHEVDDEELRECADCECTAFEAPK